MKYFLLFLLIISSVSIDAQTEIKLFYNTKGEITDSLHAKFYKQVVVDENNLNFHGLFKDYTTEGILIREGAYSNNKLHGNFKSYYNDGSIQSTGTYSVGFRSNEWLYYYDNGQLQYKVVFTAGNPELEFKYNFSVIESYTQEGQLIIKNGTGLYSFKYKENGLLSYVKDYNVERKEVVDVITISGQFLNGKKEGKWSQNYSVQKYFNRDEEFKNDTFCSGIKRYQDMETFIRNESYDIEQINKFPDFYKGNLSTITSMRFDTTVFKNNLLNQDIDVILTTLTGRKFEVKNRNAGYAEGDYELDMLITKSIKYPTKQKEEGIEGTIYFTLSINKEGQMVEFQKMNSVHPELDKEAERVISNIKEGWLPAIRNGVVVNEKILVTVTFELN
jgi:hypothetical protein